MQKLLKQGYVVPTLDSSLHILHGHYHELVDSYEISIFEMATDFSLFILSQIRFLTDLKMSNTSGIL